MNIGIDLGTTNTVVSYIDEYNQWKFLTFEENGSPDDNKMLPSCISVGDKEIKVGRSALTDRLDNADNFLNDSKYFMGEKMLFYRAGKPFSPKDVAREVLKEVMRELKKQFPNEKEFNAFVTVPARFNDAARKETKDALTEAGFVINEDKRSLTDEPVAAAIAYSRELTDASKIFVVDFGGGTFDLSIIETNAVGVMAGMNSLKVNGWGGDLHLGGNDVDKLLVEKMIEKFVEDGGEKFDPWALYHTPEVQRAVALIMSQPLEIKKQLYSDFTQPAYIYVPDLLGGEDLDFEITPNDYKNMMNNISLKYQDCIKDTLSKENYKSSDIDKVLIVGGMAHEPCLRGVLLSIFDNNEEKLIIPDNSMYLVSKGAAIWNSNADLHVENRIYSSIGILLRQGAAVKTVVREGSLLDDKGRTFTGTLELSDNTAETFRLIIVEYSGAFVPDSEKYNKILNRVITLSYATRKKRAKKAEKADITVSISIDADKIFTVNVRQPDGTLTEIALRLNN